MNRNIAIHVLEELLKAGVREFVICPGARNAPFANLLSASSLTTHYWYEERSAAFFALGRARGTKRPVAILTTSGTAAGELLPAMMEAYYTSTPLIAVTADRPKCYRGTNAPQTADQVGLFGVYAMLEYDLEGDERCSFKGWKGRSPVHINVCLEEPANEETPYQFNTKDEPFKDTLLVADSAPLKEFFKRIHSPLVVVSTLKKEDREAVLQFLVTLNAPVFVEGVSGLCHEKRLRHLKVFEPNLKVHDGVLRIGGVPTHRLWRDLEMRKGLIDVLAISEHPFSGLSYAPIIHTRLAPFFINLDLPKYKWEFPAKYFEIQERLSQELEQLYIDEPQSEPALIRSLSSVLPESTQLFLGNSMPIRYWDLGYIQKPFYDIVASRGLNGIDGQIATFFGHADPRRLNIGLIGDLTALYDFAALWHVKDKPDLSYALVVINNGGGKIFAHRFPNADIHNPHALQFSAFASFWHLPYQNWTSIPTEIKWEGLIELVPDNASTDRFMKQWNMIKRELQQELLATV